MFVLRAPALARAAGGPLCRSPRVLVRILEDYSGLGGLKNQCMVAVKLEGQILPYLGAGFLASYKVLSMELIQGAL